MNATIMKALRAEAKRLRRNGSDVLRRMARESSHVEISTTLESILLDELRVKAALDALTGGTPRLPALVEIDGARCRSLDGCEIEGITVHVARDGIESSSPPAAFGSFA